MITRFPLDDHFVCLDTQTQALSVANPVAARILELHLSGQSIEQVCTVLSNEFSASREQIEHDVTQLVAQLDSDTIKAHRPSQNHEPDTEYRAQRPFNSVAEMQLHLPCGTVTISSESTSVIDGLKALFRLSAEVVQEHRVFSLKVYKEAGRYPIVYNGETLDIGLSAEQTTILCLRVVNILVSHVQPYAFTLHAAAVALADSGVLLAAKGGSGKSTLTAFLLTQDYALINDDAIQVSIDPPLLVPIPVPLSVKQGSWSILAEWFPQLAQQESYGPAGFQQRYLPPSDNQVCLLPVPCNVVCFPQYRAGAPTRVLPVERPAALSMLIESGCYLPKPINAAHVQRFVNWIQGLEFHTLEYSCLIEAEAVIRNLLEQKTNV